MCYCLYPLWAANLSRKSGQTKRLFALENQLFPHVRFCDYGEDGMGHPGYRAAYTAALYQAKALLAPGKKLVEVRAAETPQESEGGTAAAGESGVRMYILVRRGDGGRSSIEHPRE
jgi:hypothetical protein